ncbi:MAG: hypothetical protein RIS51_286 [Actinomycetota bacterium]
MSNVVEKLRPGFKAQSRHFYVLLGLTGLIVFIGLGMVASASAVDSFKETSNVGYTFFRQGFFAIVGGIALAVAANLPVSFIKKLAPLLFISFLALQTFTVLFGTEINGNRNWINLGLFSIQPSEFLKVALILSFALILSDMGYDEYEDRQKWVKLFLQAGIALGLVALAGKDMGTGVVMGLMVLGLFLFAGMKLQNWLLLFGGVIVAGVVGIMMSPSRMVRFQAWLNPEMADPMGVMWQYEHGTWALAAGGIFGTGLGRSKLKWSWIPEVENDFIFAIIGEELGLLGAMVVILLFFALGMTMFAIAKKQTEPFNRLVVMGVMLWIVLQAFINIGVVLGLFPVLGVPLPLISAGGSSLIATLGAIGLVLAMERDSNEKPRRKR